jgi:hypothetical protein
MEAFMVEWWWALLAFWLGASVGALLMGILFAHKRRWQEQYLDDLSEDPYR